MAQRPNWEGYLQLSLVTCTVAMYAANRDRRTLHFNVANPKTGNRIWMVTQDAETEEQLSRRNFVNDYEYIFSPLRF